MNHSMSTDSAIFEQQKSDLLKTVAANLKAFRNNSSLTQEQLAERTSLSTETIGNLENAKSWF
ncbi:MAG: helix-turn-helix transcriptional regulator, partial [Treponema sp.]|nr:helix-turn-helix transcriptional regulator [Treponema sp.]